VNDTVREIDLLSRWWNPRIRSLRCKRNSPWDWHHISRYHVNFTDENSRIRRNSRIRSLRCKRNSSWDWHDISMIIEISRQFHVSWWVLQHCTGFARLVWGRRRVHRAFVYSHRDITSISQTRILGYVGILEYDHGDVNETVREFDIISPDITSISRTRILGYVGILEDVGILEYDHGDVMSFSRTVFFDSLARRFRGPSWQKYSSWYLSDRVRDMSLQSLATSLSAYFHVATLFLFEKTRQSTRSGGRIPWIPSSRYRTIIYIHDIMLMYDH